MLAGGQSERVGNVKNNDPSLINSLRVFGCLPVTARGAARRQASEKPRRRKPRGSMRRRRATELGAAEFLTKPIDFDLLRVRLRRLPNAAD